MIDLIQLITVQQAYDEITHERWRASWNCRWRKVDDDDGDDFPSPEPKTDSKSALRMKNRMWRRLRIAKHDETFSMIFFRRKGRYRAEFGGGGAMWAPQACTAWPWPVGLWPTGMPPQVDLCACIFLLFQKNLRKFSGCSENFYFCTKTTPRQFC